jgi:putative tricarboxylic transport membrane protein
MEDLIVSMGQGAAILFNPDTLFITILYMIGGLMLGMFVGALPGLTTLTAMAILLPIVFFLEPIFGIPFLLGIYKGGIYGGSIPAILVSMPGTGAAVATTFDGPALTRQGKGRKALEVALFSSVAGDFTSDIFTIFAIVPIALIALKIGPPELAAVLFLSLIVISATGSGAFVKSLLVMVLGLFIAMIGQDPIGALSRFTFGVFELRSGISLLPMLIGLFALSELLLNIEKKASAFIDSNLKVREGERLRWHEFRACGRTIMRSTVIGTSIGIIPGVGQVVAAFVGYAAAKNASKHPEKFGKGELEGVAAAEAANNAVNGPTLVPMLTFGIPGDNITAILLGAFIAVGMRPGPQLMAEQGPQVFAILLAMVLANVLFLIIGYLSIPLFARVVRIPKTLLMPLTIMFAFAGVFAVRNNPTDLYVLGIFGVVGYVLRKFRFDVAPLAMAFILGPEIERAISQTLSLSKGDVAGYIIFERPITLVILVLTPIIAWSLWRRSTRLRRESLGMTTQEE